MSLNNGRYHTLDGMRGVAALMVAVYHFEQRAKNADVHVWGYLAVDLFFALSGFVIATNYISRMSNGLTVARFMKIRTIRLYPLYLFGHILGSAGCIMHVIVRPDTAMTIYPIVAALILNSVMIPTPLSPELFPLNGPSWSLFFEFVANIGFAVILWKIRTRALIVLCAISAIYLAVVINAPLFFNVGWGWGSIDAGFARTMFSFCAGILVFRRFGHHSKVSSWLAIIPICIMVGVMTLDVADTYRSSFELIAVIVLFPVLLFAGAIWDVPPVARKLCGFLGDISYPIYVVHWPLIGIIKPVLGKLPSDAYAISAYLIILTVLGYMVGRFYDAPVRQWINSKARVRFSARPDVIVEAEPTPVLHEYRQEPHPILPR